MPDWFLTSWQWVSGAAVVVPALGATTHVVLNKRDSKAATGWSGLIWFAPGAGPCSVVVFAIEPAAPVTCAQRPPPRRGRPRVERA